MSKIIRYSGNLLAFASNSTALNRTIFADAPNQSDLLTGNITADYLIGWENGLDPINGFPPQEYFNAVAFVSTLLSSYLHQVGIAEYDPAQEYHVGSFSVDNAILYRSLINDNIGNDPVSSPSDWFDVFSAIGISYDDSAVPITATNVQEAIDAIVSSIADVVVPGTMSSWPTSTVPDGWLERDGSAISRTTYSGLFAVISTNYGVGDGSTTFNLPDNRGEFERGWDHTSGIDPDAATRTDRGDGTTGNNVGTKQDDDFASHTHAVSYNTNSVASGSVNNGAGGPSSFTSGGAGGNETRPINYYSMPIIKY